MVLLILVTLGLMLLLGLIAWSAPDDPPSREDSETAGPSPAVPTTLEGVLAAQLVAGAISAAQYRKAVTGIAQRDEARHPLSAPGEQ